ncbi:hypothetical protein C8C85_0182 [Flavobacterium sp. 103]|uniref:hypothetical protein n=1 Tax=Flavobacterium sp. 103 TaxID=2135624 RepID=UPI000D5CC9C9|nr:hypothetical protein [Flavobacterium sp. 103]PVX44448.1 hypothetical protein C8C85_0182 [Flavobacterium sp. 103]
MTDAQKEVLKYKDYPEGSGSKRHYDSLFLPFQDYLVKYYTNPDLTSWERWKNKYIELAFDKKRHDEMIKNFGYAEKKYYDFVVQNKFYLELINEDRIGNDTKKFIGFLAGAGFFRKYNLTLKQWFDMKNWSNPNFEEAEDGKAINEILNYSYGENYIKTSLPHLPFWNR